MKKFVIPLLAVLILAAITVAGTLLAGSWSPSPEVNQPQTSIGNEPQQGQTGTVPTEVSSDGQDSSLPDDSDTQPPPIFPADDNDPPPEEQDRTVLSWWFKRNNEHKPPEFSSDAEAIVEGKGMYLGNTIEKKVFLTFDEGYENGFTPRILDTLRDNGVKAAFFVTSDFVDKNPGLVKRMASEEHVIGNHTATHPSLPKITNSDIRYEISDPHIKVYNLTGIEMRFMRPPMGEYNSRVLNETNEFGYLAVFWSIAYRDWETDNQPGKDVAFKHVMDNLHPGAIILLHAVSESNTEALDGIIKGIKSKGYTFESLNEIE